MKSKLFLMFFGMVLFQMGIAQKGASFKIDVPDTIGIESTFEVRFELENVNGQRFMPPDFDGFRVVGGPNQSTSLSIINGKTTRQMSYTYYLEPLEKGKLSIGSATIDTDNGKMQTEPVSIVVTDDYENNSRPSVQRRKWPAFPDEETETQPDKPAKVRKIYKL